MHITRSHSCKITQWANPLVYVCVCRSQQKAAGRASSPTRQPATLADGPRAWAPVPPTTESRLPEPALHRPSAPGGLGLAEPAAEFPLSATPADVPRAVCDMQQLQSNLLRPATPPSARLQAPTASQAPAGSQADLQGGRSAKHSGNASSRCIWCTGPLA